MSFYSPFLDIGVAGESALQAFKKTYQGAVKSVTKSIETYKKDQESKVLADHFVKFFNAKEATEQSELDKCYRLRHQVYCEEMNYLPVSDDMLEKSAADYHSLHCTIQHNFSKHFGGTVRLVYTETEDQKLPVEEFCGDSITDDKFHPNNFPREEICEISRLAVPASFRRRKMDQFQNAATGGINEYEYSEVEMRCFPFVAIGLYLAAGAAALRTNRPHVFVMMEPRLARNMQFVGITFHQIGNTVNYHGKRAPYYINAHDFKKQLKPAFKKMLSKIDKQVYELND